MARGGSFDPLARRGPFYYRPDGSPFTVIETTGFAAFEKHLRRDPSLDDYLKQASELGFNVVRVFMLNTSVHHLLPAEWPNYYDEVPAFIARLGSYGLYAELVAFTQTQTLMPRLEDQQAHYDRLVAAIGPNFVFLEGANEYEQHDNAYDPRLNLHKPAGATFDLCSGSQGSGQEVPLSPVRDSIRYHSNDQSEWQRKQAHNGMEMSDHNGLAPCLANENTRTDKDPTPYKHHDAAAGAALLMAGSCLHSSAGKMASPLSGVELECAQQFIVGVRSVDLTQRTQPYFRIEDPSIKRPEDLRVYQRGSCVVHVRR